MENRNKLNLLWQERWLCLCAKIYCGKSKYDFGKAYTRLRIASDKIPRPYYECGPCLSEVHAKANKEFGMNIYL